MRCVHRWWGTPKVALKKRLKKKGITHEALAGRAGVDRTTVTHWLGGRLVSQHVADTVRKAAR